MEDLNLQGIVNFVEQSMHSHFPNSYRYIYPRVNNYTAASASLVQSTTKSNSLFSFAKYLRKHDMPGIISPFIHNLDNVLFN